MSTHCKVVWWCHKAGQKILRKKWLQGILKCNFHSCRFARNYSQSNADSKQSLLGSARRHRWAKRLPHRTFKAPSNCLHNLMLRWLQQHRSISSVARVSYLRQQSAATEHSSADSTQDIKVQAPLLQFIIHKHLKAFVGGSSRFYPLTCGKQPPPKDESLKLITDPEKEVGNELHSISLNMSSAETVRRLNIYKPEGGAAGKQPTAKISVFPLRLD